MRARGEQTLIARNSAQPTLGTLVPLNATSSRQKPLVCLPGAGASVTAFIDLINVLGTHWPAYGLQPRGVDGADRPHDSVEAAARHNIVALDELGCREIHLLGHSHGGRVAFETALLWQAKGRRVASLTLVDSEPPEVDGALTTTLDEADIFRGFVSAFELTFGKSLPVDNIPVGAGRQDACLSSLHASLTKHGCLPARSSPAMLRGPLAAYTAARRSVYTPGASYAGTLQLVLVRDMELSHDEDLKQREAYATQWRSHASDLRVWHGPGHHFSILQMPHVQALAQWWREGSEP